MTMFSTLLLQIEQRPLGVRIGELLAQFWPILLTAALGCSAIYLLLPRARRFPPLWGAAVAGLTLIALGWLLHATELMAVESVLFYAFSGLAVVFAGLMIAQRNPVHAALSFAMVVLSTCGLFLLLAAPFLMAATIIIYAGAIVVTFLFVIMLAQQAGLSSADQRSREPFLATVAGFVLVAAILCVLHQSYRTSRLDPLIEQASQAAEAKTVAQWQSILGQDDTFFQEFRAQLYHGKPPPIRENMSAIEQSKRDLYDTLDETQLLWNSVKPRPEGADKAGVPGEAKLDQLRKSFARVKEYGLAVRQGQGSVQPNGKVLLSPMSGVTPDKKMVLDKNGKPVEQLPAENVAGLGKALFTDYLLAVELAGTLLLVVTIGAIAIAGRRPEGLR